MNLYTLSSAFKSLQAMIDDEDASLNEAIAETIASMSSDVEFSVENAVKLIKNMDSDVDAISEEIKRLTVRKHAIESAIHTIRTSVVDVMTISNLAQVKTPLFTVSVSKGRNSCVVDDVLLIPDEFKRREVILTPDRIAIAKAIENGADIPGASLKMGSPSLRVR